MKTWWQQKGWPWLKENWWVLLLLPLLLLTGLTIVLYDLTRTVQVVDPLREADARARKEAETRARELQAEKERLETELAGIWPSTRGCKPSLSSGSPARSRRSGTTPKSYGG